MTLISVVIPTFNRGHLLDRAIDSVLSQTYRELELIVVDDGSTDDTGVVVERRRDERVSYIRQDNAGAPSARNRGVAVAKGAWIAFLDSDDEWDPELLEAILPFAANDRVVFTSHTVVFRSGTVELVPDAPVSDAVRTLLRRNIASTQTALLPTHLAQGNPFDVSLPRFQDWDLWLTLIAADVKFVHIPISGATLYRQDDSISEGPSGARQRSLRLILAKHMRVLRRDPVALARLFVRAYSPGKIVAVRHRRRSVVKRAI
ncbi:glycosyltransferase family 2 protein [Agromyces allii]|uniref:Glycosyltransferase 2-like domain-containing protein n=1 Tax=Agromyces allii TaxID=393607 RepID=A0ABN2R1L6_9MICO|nr:glycosyltransferase family A protein [Agromyces allii]